MTTTTPPTWRIVLALPPVGALLLVARGLRWLALRLIDAAEGISATVERSRR